MGNISFDGFTWLELEVGGNTTTHHTFYVNTHMSIPFGAYFNVADSADMYQRGYFQLVLSEKRFISSAYEHGSIGWTSNNIRLKIIGRI